MKRSFKRPVILFLVLAAIASVGFFSPAFGQEIERIKADDLKKMIENKSDIVVVDAQPKGAYDLGHIPGAVNFPWATKIKTPSILPRNKLLVLYCACSEEEDSLDMAGQLIKKFGYKQVKVLEGGWVRWLELGYPIAK